MFGLLPLYRVDQDTSDINIVQAPMSLRWKSYLHVYAQNRRKCWYMTYPKSLPWIHVISPISTFISLERLILYKTLSNNVDFFNINTTNYGFFWYWLYSLVEQQQLHVQKRRKLWYWNNHKKWYIIVIFPLFQLLSIR